jgi:excinuclease ABC subunit A
MEVEKIIIRGARQHNLKDIDVDVPRNRLIVVTGLSGSGKSTLAFDTLYAEGQRRYVESLSTYARQFLEQMDKPDVDTITGLSPAIALEQKTAAHNPRSTVGTVTEVYDYLRLLFARIGTPFCHRCGQRITSQTVDQMVDAVLSLPPQSKIIILSPLVTEQAGNHDSLIRRLKRDGFARVRIDGRIHEIESVGRLDPKKTHTLEAVVDRLIVKDSIRNRLADSLELALSLSDGFVSIDIEGMEPLRFSERAVCSGCGAGYPELTPASFSFNSPHGACKTCDGMGTISAFDPELIVPNPHLSLREGAVAPWAKRSSVYFFEFLDALTGHYGTDIHTPYADLSDSFKKVLLFGSGEEKIRFYFERNGRRTIHEKPYEGIIPTLERRYVETDSYPVREEIKGFMNSRPCPDCSGMKLNPQSRAVRVGNLSIHEIASLPVADSHAFFRRLPLEGKSKTIAERIQREILERLDFLQNVGLSYLTLDRPASTLSGGESQRIRLATQIGSKLTGVLYVLDEPSIGLHPRDNRRLIEILLEMRNIGNTVLVVEHDENTILEADHVIEMGPGAGVNGGQVVFSGPPDALLKHETSLTGQYLSGRKRIEIPARRRSGSGRRVTVRGASANNLKGIDVEFPLGCFICVTGVSGSGKSTLVLETLYRAIAQKLYRTRTSAGAYGELSGLEHLDKAIHIDQSPIGKTPRSNPGTYTGVFGTIRELFAKTPDSRVRGYGPGRFSFNVKGGRCEACQGEGIIRIEMHFLPDVYVACDVCRGKRYNRETLEVKYKGKNISEVLGMTVQQAMQFFGNIGQIRTKLETMVDVGIGYICLGQPATTLSGGEAQRIKLARELSKKGTGNTLYILDEPTTGLHADDIQKLLLVLNRLVDAGNTVIIIEHQLDIVKTADFIIDLGPEGGSRGGHVVGCGTPEAVAEIPESYTGQYLKRVLWPHRRMNREELEKRGSAGLHP